MFVRHLGVSLLEGQESWIFENGGSGEICNLWLLWFSYLVWSITMMKIGKILHLPATYFLGCLPMSVLHCTAEIFCHKILKFSATVSSNYFIFGVKHDYDEL